MKICKKIIALLTIIIVLTGVSGTHANAATDPYLLQGKWEKPIVSIYIDDTPYTSNIPSINYTAWRFDCVQAISRWSTYLNNIWRLNINLVFADTKADADIIIQYGVSTSWAHTVNTYNGTSISKSKIVLDDWDLKNYNFDTYTVTNIVMHELGHALGLAQITVSHAQLNNISSVMIESVSSSYFSGNPTSFDETNLRKLY